MSLLAQGIELPFTYGFFQSRSPQQAVMQCVNYRPNINQLGSLSQESLYQTEGVSEIIASVDNVTCRGIHRMNSIAYIVLGVKLYRINQTINANLTKTYDLDELGDVDGSGRVIMASIWSGTGYEMAIVSPGQFAYSYTEAGGVVNDLSGLSNFLGPVDDVVSLNGFMVFLQTGTNTIFHSNLNDVSTYNALDFELVTRSPKLVGLVGFRGQLYVMGENEMLPYSFIGGANFVFQYQPNSTIPSGLNNVHSKVTVRQSIAYLGGGENESLAVWLTSGGYPTKISTEAIEFLIRQELAVNNSFLLAFSINGAEYIALRVGDYCFVYDILTGRWHQRRSKAGDLDIAWRVNHITNVYGELIVGDSLSAAIGKLDNSNTEFGTNIHRQFVLQPFDNKGKHVPLKSVVLAMDVGFNGSMVFDWSDDGHTWSNGMQLEAGGIGDYGRHMRWDRLGTASYARSLRFSTSSPVQCNVNKVLALS